MSISARAKHVMSVMLIVASVLPGSAWASATRTTHCHTQMATCHDTAVLTCCGPAAPLPVDRAPLPEVAASPSHVTAAPLVDPSVPQSPAVLIDSVPSPHWLRVLDLPILHRTFVI